jgi:hypothetical protein
MGSPLLISQLLSSPPSHPNCSLLPSFHPFSSHPLQVNDDTVIVTPNWALKFVETLSANPSIRNFGVTGPSDSNNDKIFTHSFVHRTHMEVSCRGVWSYLLWIMIL